MMTLPSRHGDGAVFVCGRAACAGRRSHDQQFPRARASRRQRRIRRAAQRLGLRRSISVATPLLGSNDSGTTGTRATLPAGTSIAPGCYLLLTNGAQQRLLGQRQRRRDLQDRRHRHRRPGHRRRQRQPPRPGRPEQRLGLWRRHAPGVAGFDQCRSLLCAYQRRGGQRAGQRRQCRPTSALQTPSVPHNGSQQLLQRRPERVGGRRHRERGRQRHHAADLHADAEQAGAAARCRCASAPPTAPPRSPMATTTRSTRW